MRLLRDNDVIDDENESGSSSPKLEPKLAQFPDTSRAWLREPLLPLWSDPIGS